MWTIDYRSRYGKDTMTVEALSYEEAEEVFILERILNNDFGVVLSIKPIDQGSPTPTA